MHMVKQIFNFLQAFFKPLKAIALPAHIQIEPTTFCNLHCGVCPRTSVYESFASMDNNFFADVIRQIRPVSVTFNGLGEQFLDKGVFEKIKILKNLQCKVNLTTNFSTVDAHTIGQLIDTGIDLVSVSLDAPDKEHYLKFRGKDCFDKIIENIITFNKMKSQTDKFLPHLRLSFVVHNDSVHLMSDFCHLGKKHDADALLFQPIDLPYNPEKRNEFIPDKLDLLTIEYKKTLQLCKKLKINTNIKFLLNHFKEFENKYKFLPKLNWERACSNPWFSAYIQVDGKVTPCCSIVGDEYVIGNLHNNTFKELWNNSKFQSFRKLIRDGKRPTKACKTCVPFTIQDAFEKQRFTPNFLSNLRLSSLLPR